MNRLKQTVICSYVGAGSQTQSSNQTRCLVRENVPEKVGGYDYVEDVRLKDKPHGCNVNKSLFHFNLRIILRNLPRNLKKETI